MTDALITSAEEIEHYDSASDSAKNRRDLELKLEKVSRLGTAWAVPLVPWLDSVHDGAAQADVYAHLSPKVAGGRVVQIGGSGQAALKALVGGAAEAILVTPSQGEANLATQVAGDWGIGDRFSTVVAFAESIPLEDGSVTAVISEACMHHTNVSAALRESARILEVGGRFGAWDPWKARLYNLGIAVFGKRDPDVNCRPMEPARVTALEEAFPAYSEIRLHGALTRYPGIVCAKLGRAPSVTASVRLTRIDDAVSRRVPALARNGSSCSILGTK